MRFRSTRGEATPSGFSAAIFVGLASDGGLFVPESFPRFDPGSFDPSSDFATIAAGVIAPFLDGDPLSEALPSICDGAFDFPMPLSFLREGTALLELYHGPTAAFKDFGARFLAACMERHVARPGRSDGPVTVLVATSGDTGGAVASAFHGRRGVRVAVLYPKGGVAPRQEQQLTCWGGNVTAFAVRGTFDDCQRMVKDAFADPQLRRGARLTSANSINIGRLLPQAAYYAAAALRYRAGRGREPGIIVPTGNVGNAVGAFWARRMGFPIRSIVMATNANRTIPDWFDTSEWRPRPSIATLANAMDVGDPSNMERLFDLHRDPRRLLEESRSAAVDDATIREVIAAGPRRWGRVFCPHTATAVHLREQSDEQDWILVATAHPAKFDSIVEPLVGRSVEPPPSLAALLSRSGSSTEIDADVDELSAYLREG